MSRLIIENRSRLTDAEALHRAAEVVADGRVSQGGYCFATVWYDGICVYALRNKASDRLIVEFQKRPTPAPQESGDA